MENLYYKPSGKIPVKGLFISLVTAIAITVVLSIVYIALQWFIPFIYLNFFIAAGLLWHWRRSVYGYWGGED